MKVIDLFAGIGGWDIAAQNLGHKVTGIELDKQVCKTRLYNNLETVQAEISFVNPEDYKDYKIQVASPPCQGFSKQGKMLGWKDLDIIADYSKDVFLGRDTKHEVYEKLNDKRSLLITEPLRWALINKPQFIAWEQVPYVYDIWVMMSKYLEDSGYSVAIKKLFSEEYGDPQTRERVILIARLDGEAKMPKPTNQKFLKGEPKRGDLGVYPWVAIEDVLPDRKEWSYKAGTRSKSALRLSSEPASTITFGSDYNNHVWLKDNIKEKLTIRDCLTLQSFPKDFELQGSRHSQFGQIANAIPVRLAESVLSMV